MNSLPRTEILVFLRHFLIATAVIVGLYASFGLYEAIRAALHYDNFPITPESDFHSLFYGRVMQVLTSIYCLIAGRVIVRRRIGDQDQHREGQQSAWPPEARVRTVDIVSQPTMAARLAAMALPLSLAAMGIGCLVISPDEYVCPTAISIVAFVTAASEYETRARK